MTHPTYPTLATAAGGRLRPMLRRGLRRLADDEGAITTMAAVAFAGLLVAIMRSDEVRGILTDLVRRALSFSG